MTDEEIKAWIGNARRVPALTSDRIEVYIEGEVDEERLTVARLILLGYPEHEAEQMVRATHAKRLSEKAASKDDV